MSQKIPKCNIFVLKMENQSHAFGDQKLSQIWNANV